MKEIVYSQGSYCNFYIYDKAHSPSHDCRPPEDSPLNTQYLQYVLHHIPSFYNNILAYCTCRLFVHTDSRDTKHYNIFLGSNCFVIERGDTIRSLYRYRLDQHPSSFVRNKMRISRRVGGHHYHHYHYHHYHHHHRHRHSRFYILH